MAENQDEFVADSTLDSQDPSVLHCKIRPRSDEAAVESQSLKENPIPSPHNTPVATPQNDSIETWTRSDAGQKGSETVNVRRFTEGGKELFEILKPSANPELKANDPPAARSRFGCAGKKSCKMSGTWSSTGGRQNDQNNGGT